MSTDDICWLDAVELAARIRLRDLSPVEVLEAYQQRIEEVNGRLNAIVTHSDTAMVEARRAEAAVLTGGPLAALHGVPFTVKDSFDVGGVRTTRGSMLFTDHVPDRDATAVARLRDVGGILLGKTNVPEFVLWAETDNRVFGRTRNPWDLDRTPGGSSGGEAAAIAGGLSPLGVGSDLSGSIRLPAHYCGIVGLKPTHGRVPMTGHWPATLQRFTHIGPLARSARDARLALELMEGADGHDWYAEAVASQVGRRGPLAELRVGWMAGSSFGPLDAAVASAVVSAAEALTPMVASVDQVRIPSIDECDYDLLTMDLYGAEGGPYFTEVIVERWDMLHPVLRNRLQQSGYTLSNYLAAQAAVERLRADMVAYFRDYDVLLCPVGPVPAPVAGQSHLVVGGEQRRARSVLRATIPFDLAGLPAASVPFGRSVDGLPIGVQVVARPFGDHLVLDVAEQLSERARMSRPDLHGPSHATDAVDGSCR